MFANCPCQLFPHAFGQSLHIFSFLYFLQHLPFFFLHETAQPEKGDAIAVVVLAKNEVFIVLSDCQKYL
jgi:hypothetical protein